mgnify:FL=1
MSILYMTYVDSEDLDSIEQIVSKIGRQIYIYDAFEKNKLKKLLVFSKHLVSSILNNEMINIYQGSSRLIFLMKYFDFTTNIFINHGWGTKKEPGSKEISSKKGLYFWRKLRQSTDYVICHSDFDSSYFMRHELLDDLPLPKFVPLGHPRNDFLVRNKNNGELINQVKTKLKIPSDNMVILFAPTHRESLITKNNYDEKLLKYFLYELEAIDKFLSEKKIVLLFRPHYYFNFDNYAFKNIRIVSSHQFRDPRPLMISSDILITDYSSIYVDYLLLQKPIVFYQPDLEYYQEIRGLVIDPNNKIHMPGPKINSLRDILDINEKDFESHDLLRARDFFHKYSDDKSTERLIKFISDIAKK